MKKKIISILLIIALLTGILVGLTACGKNDDDDEDEKEGKASSEAAAVVEDYFTYVGELKFAKAFKLIDWTGYMMTSEGYDYDEIEDEYEEFAEDNEYYLEDYLDEDSLEEFAEMFAEEVEDYENFEVKVKKVQDAEKVKNTKNIYSVEIDIKATIQADEDDDKEVITETYEVYVMKKDGDYYIIGGIDDFMESI